ncbi:FAD linked oxidase protein [Necator americanus]|uniref:D-2-hydroxyglutarate dehydrogenase, mitochondrial n=1 Tax=Necator americanus TaxID=51031 RepID=W2T5A4_NECAM|nr:FAD linked oxidase protein [Necator americanus]ETN76356.1 FAD linked oxidase protein [Necator americanus]
MLLKSLRFGAMGLATMARDTRFATVQDADIRKFESICGRDHVRTTEIDGYKMDWTKAFKGDPACVLLPASSEEVSAILAHCSRRKIAVVPQAGNTGLVGGSVPLYDEIVLSVKRINNHFEFDEKTGVLSCDAGFILEELDNKLASYGFMMPLDLGAKGSCMIGGNVATCAGGIRLLRYGNFHAHLLGLTVVGVETFESCCDVLRMARCHLSEILSSFEFMDREIMTVLDESLGLKPVLKTNPRFTLLVETSGSNEAHDKEKMERFLAHCIDDGLISDGVQALSASESSAMWRLRESAPMAVASDGFVFKNDVSLPLKHFYQLTEQVRLRCSDMTKHIVTYGHMGDGNSHLNITAEEFSKELYDRLYPFIYEWVSVHGGSISAEHGIGQLKLPYSGLGKSLAEREIVRRIKSLFDPNGILNPYKSF